MSQRDEQRDSHSPEQENGEAENDPQTLSADFGILSALIAASARNNETSEAGNNGSQRISITINQLLNYITRNGGGAQLAAANAANEDDDEDYVPGEDDEDEDEEDEGEYTYPAFAQRNFNNVGHYFPRVTEPQEAGLKLLYSGDFGPPPSGPVEGTKQAHSKPQSRRASRRARRTSEATTLDEEEDALVNPAYPAYHTSYRLPVSPLRTPFAGQHYRAEVARGLIPNSPGSIVAQYQDKAYSGQFSLDANIFYSCTQGHDVWVYDANSTGKKRKDPVTRHESRMKLLNRVKGVYGNWTITDSHLSPDNERVVYSSISPVVHLTKLHEPEAQHISLDFSGTTRGSRRHFLYDNQFGIWTCRFSADGKEVVACGSHQIFVWDLTAHRRTVSIPAHEEDVNSCCWADTSSGNVLVSGSDDTMVKVWDRRSLSTNRPSGVLPGHTEGITSVSAKGDGRYIISNGKDHALRLWDLRMMREDEEVNKSARYGQSSYDYRYGGYRRPKSNAHPQDCSVMTYRGHSVFRTLIRCHFSPAETTGQAYVYSGSADGKIYIWSLDGRIVETIDRTETLSMQFDPSSPDLPPRGVNTGGHNNKIIRDCSWHPREPALLSCYWHRDDTSSVARHEWKGLGKRGMKLEDVVERDRQVRGAADED